MSADRRLADRCDVWMRNARTFCARSVGHRGAHRGAGVMDTEYRAKMGHDRHPVAERWAR